MQTELRMIRESEYPQMWGLLEKQGLHRDAHLDYSAGIFDEGKLIATGSISGSTLRCLAVDGDARGKRLMGQLVEHLVRVQYAKGNYHIFLYTKPRYSLIFSDLGFTEIVREGDRAVFMENRKKGFADYIRRLQSETEKTLTDRDKSYLEPVRQSDGGRKDRIGAIVMNANPFTLGHAYLINEALKQCGMLHVFVLSEDASLFSASDRFALVAKAVADDDRVLVHQTDSYLISQATFPAYFLGDDLTAASSQAALDAKIFLRIAEALRIDIRFMGEEPVSKVTALYNQVTDETLREAGIKVQIVPRCLKEGNIVSASTVRSALMKQNWELVRDMVPDCTWKYLQSQSGKAVVHRIKNLDNTEG